MARRNRTPSSALTEAGELDVAVCESARVNRSKVRWFVLSGVRTTRIYCRPVCPVRPAKAKNVTFYPSPAAAEDEGFRPCLRCRPETAPFSPAWKGSQTTVERAVQLISNGALDDAGVEFSLNAWVSARGICRRCSGSILELVPFRSRVRVASKEGSVSG
jgi:AraC family transcriptional regulator of adaptative response / DNA-3-methyladenine glycosylase II